jgi:anti-anti-sigma factor
MRPGDFKLQEQGAGEQRKLLLKGELDLASAASLEEGIVRLCADGAGEIVLDLSELSFIDSTGLRTILAGMKVCEQHLCSLWLTPGPATVQRVFELAGLTEALPFRSTTPVQDGPGAAPGSSDPDPLRDAGTTT